MVRARAGAHPTFSGPRGASVLALLGLLLTAAAPALAETMRGLPFTRSYPLDEIGFVSRGPRMGFDAYGRLALMQDGVYAVLNDTTWLNLAASLEEAPPMVNVVQGRDGRGYYGARGVWGVTERAPDGTLRPVSLVPPAPPAWTRTGFFEDIVATRDGIYFGSWNGVVFWNPATRQTQFFEMARGARIFPIGDRVFFSVKDQPLQSIDIVANALRPVPGTERLYGIVERATTLDATRALLSLSDGRLLAFDGQAAVPWAGQVRHDLTGRISAVQELAGGGVAVAIAGRGLFLLSAEGEMLSALTTPQYRLVTALASREPGVLWVALEDAVEKVLHGGPLTVFGERLGLPLNWPVVQEWNGRVVVASDGRLYEAVPGPAGATGHFQPLAEQPPGGVSAMTARGRRLVVASQTMLYAAEPGGGFEPVAPFRDVTHLAMVGEDLCFAIGSAELAVLQYRNGRWTEPAARIPGLRYSAVVHGTRHAAWIERGPEGIARLSLQDGMLKLESIQPGWPGVPWINLGVVDDLVVVTGMGGNRRFYDDAARSWVRPRELEELFARSPRWILRPKKDARGTIWAAHGGGVITFTPRDGGYAMDATRFDLSNERYPSVHALPGGDVWISTQRSLYHVEPTAAPLRLPSRPPAIVSVLDTRNNEELFVGEVDEATPLRLAYHRNNLALRPFSGSYAWRRPPAFQYRLDATEQWTQLDAGSALSISELREGRHSLEIRTAPQGGEPGAPLVFPFEILSPWYRTGAAYALYGVGGLLAFLGAARAFSYLARRRHRALEELVRARTAELEVAMARLNEETRHAATLAERDRLAGEIHDSMQQSLSGAILQLDTTLKMRALTEEVRSRLKVVRNMVSYTRHEVQHAVWDMESPLLEGTELGDALRKLTALINVGTVAIETRVTGTPVALGSTTKHHLLRMAQEATTNAVRHAHASRIGIELHYGATELSLQIADDGVGFVPDEVNSKTFGHFGLRGLRARADKLGARFTIDGTSGIGTRVRIEVPLAGHPNPSSHAHAETHHPG